MEEIHGRQDLPPNHHWYDVLKHSQHFELFAEGIVCSSVSTPVFPLCSIFMDIIMLLKSVHPLTYGLELTFYL